MPVIDSRLNLNLCFVPSEAQAVLSCVGSLVRSALVYLKHSKYLIFPVSTDGDKLLTTVEIYTLIGQYSKLRIS